ncbi:hypothetical protein CUMW_288680 [Citrus unshiu]|uniref:Prokaryotic-type class I peptide chain release factors domain-containing protein n=1 Tax=Citrus unshiu TaxID=55188 RepID=A0A2H5QYE8_CITUN|nr:hypothetical protein CUMW_288680 [Citrus unshiu]
MPLAAQFLLRIPQLGRKNINFRSYKHRGNYQPLFLSCNYSTNDNCSSSSSSRNYLELTDDELFRECEMDAYKSSGPGGQHRNKRESAVRLKHVPTGVIAQAAEDRSQHKNRASALSHSFGPQSEEQCESCCVFSATTASSNPSS